MLPIRDEYGNPIAYIPIRRDPEALVPTLLWGFALGFVGLLMVIWKLC